MKSLIGIAVAILLAALMIISLTQSSALMHKTLVEEYTLRTEFWDETSLERMTWLATFGGAWRGAFASIGANEDDDLDIASAASASAGRTVEKLNVVGALGILVQLMMFRIGEFGEILLVVWPLAVLAFVDGLFERTIRTHEFRGHSPVVFGLAQMIGVGVLVFLPSFCLIPYPMSPFVMYGVVMLLVFAVWRLVANFH